MTHCDQHLRARGEGRAQAVEGVARGRLGAAQMSRRPLHRAVGEERIEGA